MTSVAADVDPAVEKVIRRCLDPDPAKRPPTALAASAALPGGDPLAAALAAGETPLAGNGRGGGQGRGTAAEVLDSLPAPHRRQPLRLTPLFYARNRAVMRAPLEKSPDVLAHDARQIAVIVRIRRPAGRFHALARASGRDRAAAARPPGPKRWDAWFAYEAPVRAVYREGPAPLVARPTGSVGADNPPMAVPGMVSLAMDGHGRLMRFLGVPKKEDAEASVAPATSSVRRGSKSRNSSEDAGDARSRARQPTPFARGKGRIHCSRRRADRPGRVVARQNHAVQPCLSVDDAGRRNGAAASPLARSREILLLVLPIAVAVFAALVARRNWKQGRVDRRGALRLALARFFLGLVAWACTAHPVPTKDMIGLFQNAAADLLAASRRPLARSIWRSSRPCARAIRTR